MLPPSSSSRLAGRAAVAAAAACSREAAAAQNSKKRRAKTLAVPARRPSSHSASTNAYRASSRPNTALGSSTTSASSAPHARSEARRLAVPPSAAMRASLSARAGPLTAHLAHVHSKPKLSSR